MAICGIYKITSPSGRIYIGQSKHIHQRLAAYRRVECKGQKRLFYSIKKYGWDAHTVEILQECPVNHLDVLERIYIKMYDSFDTHHGLNLESGGRKNKELSRESRLNIGRHFIGNTFSLGKKHPPESKIKHRLASLGPKNWNYGRPISEETKQKIIAKTKGRPKSEIAKANISKNHHRRPVLQFDLNGTFIQEWPSASEAADQLGLSKAAIHNACRGYSKTVKLSIWKFKHENK